MRALLAVMLGASVAWAEPDDLVGRSPVLARGELEADLTLATSLRSGQLGRPTSLSPDVWFGVTPRLTIGVIHSSRSVDEIDADRTVCLTDCDATYEGGVDVRYLLHHVIAARARFVVRDLEPTLKPAVTLGALARWHRGRFSVTTDPYLRLGVANTDRGNRATLVIPVWLAVQPTCRWMVGLRVGYDSAIAVAADGWRGPVGAFAGVHPIAPLEIVVELGYRSLIGPQHDYRERTLMITAGWHWSTR